MIVHSLYYVLVILVLLFMVKRNFTKEQSKLGIRTLDYDVPGNHISRFVVDFIEEVFPILNIKEPKKKKGRDSLPILC